VPPEGVRFFNYVKRGLTEQLYRGDLDEAAARSLLQHYEIRDGLFVLIAGFQIPPEQGF